MSNNSDTLVVPGFRGSPAIKLELEKTREGEQRLIEARDVSPVTFADLSHTFNEAYRELKKHHANIGYQLTMADKQLEQAKAEALIDKYPEFMKDRPKSMDNADMRKAFLMRDQEYLDALDRLNQLKALEAFVEGKIKVFENVCQYMRKRMDLVIRSGLSADHLYVTSGSKKNG